MKKSLRTAAYRFGILFRKYWNVKVCQLVQNTFFLDTLSQNKFWFKRLNFIVSFSSASDQINFIESSNLKAQTLQKLATMLTWGWNRTFEVNSTSWTNQRLPNFSKTFDQKLSKLKFYQNFQHGAQKESNRCWKFPLRTVANTTLIQLWENNLTWGLMSYFQNQTFKLWTWPNNFRYGTFLVKLVNL